MVQGDSPLPQSAILYQNYPNPFNPTTTIHFSGTDGHTSLRVFDVVGREVVTLVNGSLQPGSHSVSFDASGLADGTYLCRLTNGNETLVRKMVLME